MKIQDQCCTVEQGLRLKELGVFGDSLGCYIGNNTECMPYTFYLTAEAYTECGSGWYHDRVPVYSVAELGVMLDDEVYMICASPNGEYRFMQQGNPNFITALKTEASSRAALIIILIENNLLSVDNINQRLQSA